MFTIRRSLHQDAQAIIDVHVKSIREICSKDYTPEQIEAWAGRSFKTHLWEQTIDRDFVWSVEVEGCVSGFGHLAMMDDTKAEVMGLYFLPKLLGHGAGKKLLEMIKAEARSHGIQELSLYSTVTAKSFYESQGFHLAPGDRSIGMQGIQIPCFPMSMLL